MLDPRQVLARGYAWLSDAQGAAVMSVARLATGQALTATLADGRVSAEVLAVESMPLPQAGESKLPTIARPT